MCTEVKLSIYFILNTVQLVFPSITLSFLIITIYWQLPHGYLSVQLSSQWCHQIPLSTAIIIRHMELYLLLLINIFSMEIILSFEPYHYVKQIGINNFYQSRKSRQTLSLITLVFSHKYARKVELLWRKTQISLSGLYLSYDGVLASCFYFCI